MKLQQKAGGFGYYNSKLFAPDRKKMWSMMIIDFLQPP